MADGAPTRSRLLPWLPSRWPRAATQRAHALLLHGRGARPVRARPGARAGAGCAKRRRAAGERPAATARAATLVAAHRIPTCWCCCPKRCAKAWAGPRDEETAGADNDGKSASRAARSASRRCAPRSPWRRRTASRGRGKAVADLSGRAHEPDRGQRAAEDARGAGRRRRASCSAATRPRPAADDPQPLPGVALAAAASRRAAAWLRAQGVARARGAAAPAAGGQPQDALALARAGRRRGRVVGACRAQVARGDVAALARLAAAAGDRCAAEALPRRRWRVRPARRRASSPPRRCRRRRACARCWRWARELRRVARVRRASLERRSDGREPCRARRGKRCERRDRRSAAAKSTRYTRADERTCSAAATTVAGAPAPSRRRPSVIQLVFREKGALYAAYMPLFAEGGLFVPTTREYKLGDDIYLLLSLPDDPQRYPVAGKVAWITPANASGGRTQGVGVRFPADEKTAPLQAADRRDARHLAVVGQADADDLSRRGAGPRGGRRLPRPAMFVDSHCHLTFPELAGQLPEIRAAMAAAEVDRALCICTTLEEFERVHALAAALRQLLGQRRRAPGQRRRRASRPSTTCVALRAPAQGGGHRRDRARLLPPGRAAASPTWNGSASAFASTSAPRGRPRKPLVIHTRSASADTLAMLREEGETAQAPAACSTASPRPRKWRAPRSTSASTSRSPAS